MTRDIRLAEPADELRPDTAAARRHSAAAIETMAEIMRDPKSPAASRLRAADELLWRAWGEPVCDFGDDDEPSFEEIISSLGPRDPATPTAL